MQSIYSEFVSLFVFKRIVINNLLDENLMQQNYEYHSKNESTELDKFFKILSTTSIELFRRPQSGCT